MEAAGSQDQEAALASPNAEFGSQTAGAYLEQTNGDAVTALKLAQLHDRLGSFGMTISAAEWAVPAGDPAAAQVSDMMVQIRDATIRLKAAGTAFGHGETTAVDEAAEKAVAVVEAARARFETLVRDNPGLIPDGARHVDALNGKAARVYGTFGVTTPPAATTPSGAQLLNATTQLQINLQATTVNPPTNILAHVGVGNAVADAAIPIIVTTVAVVGPVLGYLLAKATCAAGGFSGLASCPL
jgi:hypothetical protein